MTFSTSSLSTELAAARHRDRLAEGEVQLRARQARRAERLLRLEHSRAFGRGGALTPMRVISGIRRVLLPAPRYRARADGLLRPYDVPTR